MSGGDAYMMPYAQEVAELITGPLEHVAVARAVPRTGEPFELDVEEGSLELTFSEDWAPYAQAKLECSIPDAGNLERLDPRFNARIELDLGYIYPDGTEDVHKVADLALRSRPVNRPADTLNLDAGSDEYRAQDYRVLWWAGMERGGINEAVQWMADYAEHPEPVKFSSEFPNGTGRAELAEVEVQIGDDYWSIMDDCAARTGKRVWCDEFRTWRVGTRAERTGTVMHELKVGENGTIVDASSSLDREEWYNAVCLRYRWNDAANNEHIVYGRAVLTTGPFSVDAVGFKAYFEEVPRPVGQAAADAAATTRLKNLSTRGRSITLTAAAAYWLRPGHTVSVQLPTGSAELHLVQSVSFRPSDGLMTVTTRQPIDAEISNGEQ